MSINEIQKSFEILYNHARKWAPGFNIPFSLPEIKILPFDEGDISGQFCMKENPTVTIAQKYLVNPIALRLIIARESCHHILNLSSLEDSNRTKNERRTDLTMYICGFGKIALEGYINIECEYNKTKIMHLGYLSSDENQQAYKWANQRRNELSKGIDSFIDEEDRLYKKLLNIVNGDIRVLNRLINNALVNHPNMPRTKLYKLIMDEYYKDNR